MTTHTPARFRVDLGHVALDLSATLGARANSPTERLADPQDLRDWLDAVGLWPRGSDAESSAEAGVGPEQLIAARALREAIHRIVTAAMAGQPPPLEDIAAVNQWARVPVASPQLRPDLTVYVSTDNPVEAALASVAREAVALLGGPELARVKRCQGCSLIFLDRSRPGERRWCSMERCGNRQKTARYRAKRAS